MCEVFNKNIYKQVSPIPHINNKIYSAAVYGDCVCVICMKAYVLGTLLCAIVAREMRTVVPDCGSLCAKLLQCVLLL